MPDDSQVADFAKGIANYIETHEDYESLSKRECVLAAVHLIASDIGAAQMFMAAIGVDIDLYGER